MSDFCDKLSLAVYHHKYAVSAFLLDLDNCWINYTYKSEQQCSDHFRVGLYEHINNVHHWLIVMDNRNCFVVCNVLLLDQIDCNRHTVELGTDFVIFMRCPYPINIFMMYIYIVYLLVKYSVDILYVQCLLSTNGNHFIVMNVFLCKFLQ